MQKKKSIFLILFFFYFIGFTQINEIHIDAEYLPEFRQVHIDQKIVFYNHSSVGLDTIYLHNWSNAYKSNDAPLGKRLVENYDKSLYFAKVGKRGRSTILDLTIDENSTHWEELKGAIDIVRLVLPKQLNPNDSIVIHASLLVKIPSDEFTSYGFNINDINLRYWYLAPAVYSDHWHIMSNLDMDDQYMRPSTYKINFKLPFGYTLHSDLNGKTEVRDELTIYHLEGTERTDVEINIQYQNNFSKYDTDPLEIIVNLKSKNLTENIKTDVLKRQVNFIQGYLGNYPHEKLLVNDVTYLKNPVYGLNQLPKSLTPFSDVFEWDIKVFKALTKKYIDNTLFVNKREDPWVVDGIHIYLMMQYVAKYYPEIKAIGNISKVWGIKRYNLAKLDFNDKYPFIYQFSARKNLDQSLVTRIDSLSNFNRQIVNKYKAGLGIRYLDEFLKDSIVTNSLKQFYSENKLQLTQSENFSTILKSKTDKNLDWFFGDYIQTKKKIDYTISGIEKKDDSIKVNIKNTSNFTAPVMLYGVNKDKRIEFKQWIEHIDSTATVTVPSENIHRLSLNYEYLYPELNLRNNWKKVDQKILNRPLKFTFFKDVEDPYYNQIFYNLYFAYNFYDGLILGPDLYNQAMFKKKWLFHITPTFGLKSKKLTGAFSFIYEHLPDDSFIYRFRSGIAGSQSHYDDDLLFNKLTPFVQFDFHRKSLRDVGGKSLIARYVIVDKELPEVVINPEIYQYNVLDIRYGYARPDIINDLRYFADFQLSQEFSKLSFDFRYRKLTDANRQLDIRFFFGTFLFNNTESDFFSFALDRPSDYLFDYNYFGRSEDSGFFSQEIIIAEGGFKSIFEDPFANQWLLTTNGSVGIWRWVEMYADAGFVKNYGDRAYFKYDTGIRLNFIHNFLEFYFPLQSSLGFEPSLPDYGSKIRFVITLSPNKIYNFIKRGFY